jgi:hypothetical protein
MVVYVGDDNSRTCLDYEVVKSIYMPYDGKTCNDTTQCGIYGKYVALRLHLLINRH